MKSAPLDNLWQEIRREAEEAAAAEPVLASYFHAAILSHECLEQALSYNLAQLLDNPIVSGLLIRQVIDKALQCDPAIVERASADLLAHYERDPACSHYTMPLLYFKGFQALQAHRIGHWLWSNNRRPLALYLQSLVAETFSVDIHPGARIGGGVMIDHATGLVIGETAVIGDNVSMLHGVSLGGSGRRSGQRHPCVGDGVLIAAGAKLLGDIRVGVGAKVGAGSLVVESVPDHTTVAGVPARIVGRPKQPEPARDMEQRLDNGANGA